MTDRVIEYKSTERMVTQEPNILEAVDKDGILCTWNGRIDANQFILFCNFDWSQLKKQGIERIIGYLIVKGTANSPSFGEHKIDIDIGQTTKTFKKIIEYNFSTIHVVFEHHLIVKKMFAASKMNKTVLVIEGKKIHVNKAFLSYHSEFFRALFSSNFKEGQLTEIPIKDVTYQDFALLLGAIYPMQTFPTDKTAGKLLELADRFLMPSVTHIVEYHLLNNSKMGNEKLMWMADAYGMKNLLEKTIRSMDTVEKAKKLKISPEYQKLSLETIEKLFCRILQIC